LKYKRLSVLFICVIFFYQLEVKAQSAPHYEQLAFNHYANNLINLDSKFTLWLEIIDYSDFPLWYPSCLGGFNVNHSDLIFANESRQAILFIDNDIPNFKVKRNSKGTFPIVSVCTSFSNRIGQTIVNIIEEHKFYGNVYRIELNGKGGIINICSDGWLKD
jgi:hypothetical protein